MNAEKKKQLQTLLALVVVLVAVGAYTYWTNRTPSTGVTVSPAAKAARAAALPNSGNAQIRLDLIDKMDQSAVGRRNVFQYYVPPPPPPKPAPAPPPYVPPAVGNPTPPRPVAPVAPFSALSTFKCDAIIIAAKPGKWMASISEGTTNRYNVIEGEYIQGRYRINRITENSVEIEDVDQNRRQTYTRQT